MLLSWNACWEESRDVGAFSLIPQLEYGSNDCTGDVFLENSPKKLTKYVLLLPWGQYITGWWKSRCIFCIMLCLTTNIMFLPFVFIILLVPITNTFIFNWRNRVSYKLAVSRTHSCPCLPFPVLMIQWLTWQPAGFGAIFFTKRKNTELFVQLHQNVECVLWKDLSHRYKSLFMVNRETEETL